jgi:hypothetical protein
MLLLPQVSQKDIFEVLTAVTTKSAVFWDMTPYSPVLVYLRIHGVTYQKMVLFE